MSDFRQVNRETAFLLPPSMAGIRHTNNVASHYWRPSKQYRHLHSQSIVPEAADH
jgi:hypothetical protein